MRKCVYQYEYDSKKFNETSLSQKEDFYSHLSMEDITDADYGKKKSFEIRNIGEYHNLYVQGGTLLLAYVFETFRNMCLEIYELDHPKCLLAPGLV